MKILKYSKVDRLKKSYSLFFNPCPPFGLFWSTWPTGFSSFWSLITRKCSRDPEGKAFDFPVNLRSDRNLRSWLLCSDRNKDGRCSGGGWDEFPLQGSWVSHLYRYDEGLRHHEGALKENCSSKVGWWQSLDPTSRDFVSRALDTYNILYNTCGKWMRRGLV